MKLTEAILTRWCRDDPDRLLQTALRQARELALLVPERDQLCSQNAVLRQQLESQTKRIAQLEEALQGAERAAYRQVGWRAVPRSDRWNRQSLPRRLKPSN